MRLLILGIHVASADVKLPPGDRAKTALVTLMEATTSGRGREERRVRAGGGVVLNGVRVGGGAWRGPGQSGQIKGVSSRADGGDVNAERVLARHDGRHVPPASDAIARREINGEGGA